MKINKCKFLIKCFSFCFCAVFFSQPLSAAPKNAAKPAEKTESTEESFDFSAFYSEVQTTARMSGIKAAIALFDSLPPQASEDAGVNYLLGSLLLSSGQYVEAEKVAAKLLAADAKNTDYLFLNAYVAKALGNKNKKSQYLKEILKIQPDNPEANAELGNELMMAKAYEEAAKYFLKSLKTDPYFVTGLFGYGQANYYLGNFTESKIAFKKILVKNPEEDIVYSYLGKLEAEKENYDEALNYVEQAIKLNPDYYNYWLEKGNYNRLKGAGNAALEAYTKAIEVKGDYFLTYVYRGAVYERMERFDEALADYKLAVKYNPQYQYGFESIGSLSWRAGNWKDCREAYEKIAAVDSENISYQLAITACYIKENQKQLAKDYAGKKMRNLDRSSPEYAILRFYYDGLGEADVLRRIRQCENKNTRGKLLYYMAVYLEATGAQTAANQLYLEISEMKSPMFFEYTLALWAIERLGLQKM